MAIYNPNIPEILGQEWVPIRDEDLIYNQVINNVELGHSFTPVPSLTLLEGRFYVNQLPPALVRNQVFTMAVYKKGTEASSGPIRSVVIPCNNGGITGTGVSFINATTVAQALHDPSDRRYINVSLGATPVDINLFFAVNQYAQLLQGKRILGLNFLYAGELSPPAPPVDDIGQTESLVTYLENIPNAQTVEYPAIFSGNAPVLSPVSPYVPGVVNRIFLGDTNMFFFPTTGVNITTAMPWTYNDIARFEASAGVTRLQIHLQSIGIGGFGPDFTLDWCGLEVIFCEEMRLAVGCTVFGAGSATTAQQYVVGANAVTLRNPNGTGSPNIALPGDYAQATVTLAQGNMGDSPLAFTVNRIGPQPTLNALRELYPMPNQPGVQINVPAPATPDIDGQVFTVEPTSVLPQLSLHLDLAGGTISQVHPYGRQSIAQVWGNITASQDILDSGLTLNAYPQVRYYARRFGNTTVPLNLSSNTISGSGLTVSLTPAQWDALDPVIDGWKEITLRFPTSPNMGAGTNPTWTWSAPGEIAGNRWEVLGATAPAISGVPGNLFNLVPPNNQLPIATYGAPVSGSGINENWMPQYAPPVSAMSDDTTSDAVIMFSQDMPIISGVGLAQLNLPLSGIGLNCGLAPGFIPTAMAYNQLTWSPDQTSIASDIFNRISASSWGTANSGQAWSVTGGSATDYNVNGTAATALLSSTGVYRITRLAAAFTQTNVDAYVEIASNTVATGLDHWGAIHIRDNGSGDQNYISVKWQPTGIVQLLVSYVSGGVHTVQSTTTIASSYTLNTKVKVRVRAIGPLIQAKAWMDGSVEPDWLVQDSFPLTVFAGRTGTRSFGNTGTLAATTISYTNFLVSSISNGYTELQRMDPITGWLPIMKATNQAVQSFNDYEARIGLLNSYRMRYVNVYGFEGPWSATVTSTMAAPGVTATGLTATDHVMVFTTNSVQSGASNLAYSPGWEGEVSEGFNFPEGSGQVFQAMYGRDFVTVFRPSERGGTNFSRTMLVQAAAISPETLEDFTSLRNMAWADVPYICLRDEEGNRWFTNVTVPSGVVLRDRRLYMAPVSVVEVTDTPTPVDP